MRRFAFTVLLGATALSPAALAQTPAAPPTAMGSIADCDRVLVVLEQRRAPVAGYTVEQVRTFRTDKNIKACHDALVKVDPTAANQTAQGAGGSNIVVQQSAPTVRVEQSSPQVTVAQQQPDVTVNQGAPEIFVRQPAPTVTVDIPQPEITLRMPKPTVNVAMARPDVQVTQAKPQVQIVQPSQPQIEVQPGQPVVSVQQAANAQPNVTMQGGGQAQVRYEREEPKVVINQAKGEPQVKIEESAAAVTPARPMTGPAASDSNARVAAVTAPGAASPTTPMRVSRINDMNLYNAKGDNLGDIERVYMGTDNKPYIVIGHGGFLGLGEKRVSIPLERTAMRGDRLVIQGMSDEQIKAMPAWVKTSIPDLSGDKTVMVTTAR